MAKDVNKTQKKETKEKIKQQTKKDDIKKQPKKDVVKEKKDVVKEKKDIVKEEKVKVEEKIEVKKVVKEEPKKDVKKNNDKILAVIKKADDNRKAILFGVVGFLLATLLFRCILWPDRIATLSDGTQPVVNIDGEPYTADQLYLDMKEVYSINVLLNEIDTKILDELYPDNDDLLADVNDLVENYYSAYKTYYGYTKEQLLEAFGFSNEKQFTESVKLDHKRDLYYEAYVESLISDEEIKKYYEDEVYGDVDSKHILVKIAKENEEGLNDADAKKLAQEIIQKLDGGTSWDDVITEYKDKIIPQDLGYNAFNADFEAPYLEESKNLEVGKYSKTPVKTTYGYHIIFKKDQKETPKLKEVKADIVDILATQMKKDDKELESKALIFMREEAKLEFVDTVFGEAYTNFISQYK